MMGPGFLFTDLAFFKGAWLPCRYELKKALVTRVEDGSEAVVKRARLFMGASANVEPGDVIELFGEARRVEFVVHHSAPTGVAYLEVGLQ